MLLLIHFGRRDRQRQGRTLISQLVTALRSDLRRSKLGLRSAQLSEDEEALYRWGALVAGGDRAPSYVECDEAHLSEERRFQESIVQVRIVRVRSCASRVVGERRDCREGGSATTRSCPE